MMARIVRLALALFCGWLAARYFPFPLAVPVLFIVTLVLFGLLGWLEI